MRIKAIIISLALSLFSMTAFAGGNHSHDPVDQRQAEANANKIVTTLASKGVIDKSWTSVGVATSEQKKFGKNLEWVVSYKNSKVSDPQKQTLYIFLTLSGEYIAANYTGK